MQDGHHYTNMFLKSILLKPLKEKNFKGMFNRWNSAKCIFLMGKMFLKYISIKLLIQFNNVPWMVLCKMSDLVNVGNPRWPPSKDVHIITLCTKNPSMWFLKDGSYFSYWRS